jgi:hypothetical protein
MEIKHFPLLDFVEQDILILENKNAKQEHVL